MNANMIGHLACDNDWTFGEAIEQATALVGYCPVERDPVGFVFYAQDKILTQGYHNASIRLLKQWYDTIPAVTAFISDTPYIRERIDRMFQSLRDEQILDEILGADEEDAEN